MIQNSKLNLTTTLSPPENTCSPPSPSPINLLDQSSTFGKESSTPNSNLGGKRRRKTREGSNYSLFQIAQSFVTLADSYPNQGLKINFVTQTLGLKKRRLYDVINVMKGIGKIKKFGRNMIEVGNQEGVEGLEREKRRLEAELRRIRRCGDRLSEIERGLASNQLEIPKSSDKSFETLRVSREEKENKSQNSMDELVTQLQYSQLGNQSEHLKLIFDSNSDSLGRFLYDSAPGYRLEGEI